MNTRDRIRIEVGATTFAPLSGHPRMKRVATIQAPPKKDPAEGEERDTVKAGWSIIKVTILVLFGLVAVLSIVGWMVAMKSM